MSRLRQSGETIIGVAMATAIFSMLAVGTIIVMNQGAAAAQRSLEITLVRQQIDAQVESIRLIHAEEVASSGSTAAWQQLTSDDRVVAQASQFGAVDGQCAGMPRGAFAVNPRGLAILTNPRPITATDATAPPYSQLVPALLGGQPTPYGLWIETVRGGNPAAYYDFHIRTCWYTVGQTAPVTLGTIVRLHVPQ